jgi:hypothetical protein
MPADSAINKFHQMSGHAREAMGYRYKLVVSAAAGAAHADLFQHVSRSSSENMDDRSWIHQRYLHENSSALRDLGQEQTSSELIYDGPGFSLTR